MKLSILGFGCGAVGGLMVRGSPADQERAIGRALDSSVNYFDTAVQYGSGESEKNLGRILNKLKPRDAIVGTKVRLPAGSGPIAGEIARSLEEACGGSAWSRSAFFTSTIPSHPPAAGHAAGGGAGRGRARFRGAAPAGARYRFPRHHGDQGTLPPFTRRSMRGPSIPRR
jgi:hypothetical protein